MASVPHAAAGVWLGDVDVLVGVVHAGADTPAARSVDLAAVDAPSRADLLAGRSVLLAGPAAAAVGIGTDASDRGTLHLVPLVWGDRFRGLIGVSAPGALPHDLQATIRRLAADMALCMERVYSERRFRLLAEASRDGNYLLQVRPVGAFQYVNPAVEQLLGVPAEELYADARLSEELVHPDDREILHVMRGRDGMLELPVQVRVRGAEGGWRWVEIVEAPVADDARVQVVQGIVRDVTRQRQQELALRTALAQQRRAAESLRRVDDMKSAFLQAVSHELRTPLTAVLGGARTLQDREADLAPGEGGALLDMVVRNAARLERLLGDLLDVDRLSRGIVAPEREAVDVRVLAHRVVDTFESGREQVRVVAGEPVVALVDGPKVERIVDNLVRNALRHTPPGTSVTVDALPLDDGGVRLVVEDQGPGIPDEIKQTLFEPFVQGMAASRAASPGTGIGLALVQRLAELHGGRVAVEDVPPTGARFVVDLPAEAPEDQTPPDEEEDAPAALAPLGFGLVGQDPRGVVRASGRDRPSEPAG